METAVAVVELPTVELMAKRHGASVKPLTREQAAEHFKELVISTYRHLEFVQERTIEFYYHLGEAVNDVTDATHAETYGEHMLQNFMKEFNSKGATQLRPASFKYARQFYRRLSPEAVIEAQKAGIAWTNIRYLIADRVTPDIAADTIAKVHAGEVRQPDIKEHLDKLLGKPTVRKTARAPMEIIGEVSGLMQKLTDKLHRFGPTAAKLLRGTPEEADEIGVALNKAEEVAKELIKVWTAQIKIARAEQKRKE